VSGELVTSCSKTEVLYVPSKLRTCHELEFCAVAPVTLSYVSPSIYAEAESTSAALGSRSTVLLTGDVFVGFTGGILFEVVPPSVVLNWN